MAQRATNSDVRVIVRNGVDVSGEGVTISQRALRARLPESLDLKKREAQRLKKEREQAARDALIDLKMFCEARSIGYRSAKEMVAKLSILIGIRPAWPKGHRPKAILMLRISRRLPW